MAKKDRAEMMVRLPRDLKVWLKREADRNGASQNSEIIRTLRMRVDNEQQAKRA